METLEIAENLANQRKPWKLFLLMGTLDFHTGALPGASSHKLPRMHRHPPGKSPRLILDLSAFLRHSGHRSGAPKTLEVARATILNISMHLFQAPLPLPNVEAMGALEIKENLGNA